jgi:hypothetical protein
MRLFERRIDNPAKAMLQLERAAKCVSGVRHIAKDLKMIALKRIALSAAPILLISVEAQAFEPGLYNTYSANSSKTSISSSTCGATMSTSGCYGSASLGPFRRACALVTTPISQRLAPDGARTYGRLVAVMDKGALTGAQVTLSIYREIQTITADEDVTLVTSKVNTLTLPLVGGPAASCFLARNGAGFYVGTDKSSNAVLVSKTYAVTKISGFSPPIPVGSINAMEGGHVTVTHKNGNLGGFTMFRNDGSLEASGGGNNFVVGTQNGSLIPGEKATTASVPTAAASGTLLDAQGHPVAIDGKSVVRDSTGAAIQDGAKDIHFAHQ